MNNPPNQPMQQEERRRKNVLTISLIAGILFTIIAAVSGYVGYSQNGVKGLYGFGVTSAVAISAFISVYQCRRNRPSLGIAILIGTIYAVGLSIPFIVHGQGLALGIMVAIVVAGISSSTLPSDLSIRAIVGGAIVAVIITVTDLYLPDLGLPTDPVATNWIAAVTSVIYIFFILSRFNSYSLRTKIIIAFILVTVIPLIATGYYNTVSSTQSLQEQNKAQLATLAKTTASTVDKFITNQLDNIHSDSKQLPLVSYLNSPVQSRISSAEEGNARQVLNSITRKNPIFIHSIALLDKNGVDILDTNESHKGQKEGIQDYFKVPFQSKLPFASNIIFQDDGAYLFFSSPIIDRSGDTVGVLRIAYDAKIIQSIVRSIDTGYADTIILLVDKNTYIRVGYTGDRDELLKSFKNFNDLEFSVMQLENRLPLGARENALADVNDGLVAGLDNIQRTPFFEAYSDSLGSNAINTGIFLQTQPWIATIRQSTQIYMEPINNQYRTNILLSLGLIVFSIAAGFLASQILTSPLISLADVAEKITAGDFSARAKTTTEDEIGILSVSFNRMTDELSQTVNSLEARVSERTIDLENAQKQAEQRAEKLQAIGEISRIIASEQSLETLLPLITRLVSERFGYYHTGIFLINETKQFAVLQAASSAGGKNMLARGHRLEVGASGIVGYVAKYGTPRISLDVGTDAVYFNNPDLPNTRSEMALPLTVRDQIVGILDVQSEQPGAFTENDASTLNILADQIAIALDNARLFSQTQAALNEAQALYQRNISESWQSFSAEEETLGYHQSMVGGRKLTTPVQTDEITQTMNRGITSIFNSDGSNREPSIVVPIKLRGQTIGAMNIKAPAKDRQWTSDEINLVEAISERLSLALENARLIQESQRQVVKEQTISEVTGKIGASINMKNVLQTAVEELGKIMPGSEIMIKFQSGNADKSDNKGTY
ncbi:MAG: GAF domain-containing protein [Chloroflexi bacterium]|nr:GAF domain-containing protein [Chloroflexota bacterium]